MTPSVYQTAILGWPSNRSGNLLVQALAGSGKTKTLELLTETPMLANKPTVAVAFNTSIANELGQRLPFWVNASTMHKFGMQIIRKIGWVKINGNKTENILKFEVYDFKTADQFEKRECYGIQAFIIRMVSLMKANLVIDFDADRIVALAEMYGIDQPKDMALALDKLKRVWSIVRTKTKVIDFDDMIYMPLALGMMIPKSTWALVDEVQDLNPAQIELVTHMGERIICVGDVHQAIYGFRGADARAMDTLQAKLAADILPLSISYRCSKAVIREAQKIVPEIRYADNAPEGSVSHISAPQFQDGDFVLCRTSAPLIKACLKCIAKGQRANILGKDIGAGLIAFINQLDAPDIGNLMIELDAYEAASEGKRSDLIIEINDRCSVIRALAEEALSVKDAVNKINHLFAEERTDGVTFSTIHKSKGLESENVYILRPDLLPHPRVKEPWLQVQEQNLMYVAITRAKKNLFWVNHDE